MQVARVDVYGYDLTYVHGTYVMSGGREIVSLPSTVVRVTADDGTRASARRARSARPTCPRTARARAPRCASWHRRCSASTRASSRS